METNIGNYVKAEIGKIVIPPVISDVYFYTRQRVYNSYAANVVIKTIAWNSITNYSISGINDFVLNRDYITIIKSGIYRIYYRDNIREIGTGNNMGYIAIDFPNNIDI